MKGLARLALLVGATVTAATGRAEIGTQTSLGYSDNVDRIETGGRDERLLTAMIGGQVGQPQDGLERRVQWEVGAIDYLDGTYDTESVASLDSAADFALAGRRLSWHLEDQLGLQALDPFAPVTPESREYVNYFTTGPSLVLPMSTNVAFSAGLSFGDVWYEEQTLGNTRTSAQIGLRIGSSSRRSVGVYTTSQKVRYEDALHSDYERRQLFVQYQTERRRSTLSVSGGTSEIRGLGATQDEPMVQVDWDRQVSAYSRFGVTVRRGFSDAGELFQFDQTFNIGSSTSDYIGAVSNPLLREYVATRFSVAKPQASVTLTISWEREEYQGLVDPLNREIPMFDTQFSRELTPRLTFNLGGAYTRQDSLDADQEDREQRINVGLSWKVGPQTQLSVAMARFDRSSTLPGNSYDENRAFVTFSYGAGLSGFEMGL